MRALICRLPFMSNLRPGRAAAVPAVVGSGVAAVAAPGDDDDGLEEIRGAAMRRLFPKLHSWRASRRDQHAALKAHTYLSAARSRGELQQRIRAVEHRRHFDA
jgi:hypothetical protein